MTKTEARRMIEHREAMLKAGREQAARKEAEPFIFGNNAGKNKAAGQKNSAQPG